jgi:hypothetical protein
MPSAPRHPLPSPNREYGCGTVKSRKVRQQKEMPEPDRNKMDFGWELSPGLISPSPPHGQDTRGCHHIHLRGRGTNAGPTARLPHPSRWSFGTARRIWNISRSHLGSTLGSGKSCPDPGRLSTFGVSGLYPCRRLTYRGACRSMLAPPPAPRQTPRQQFRPPCSDSHRWLCGR